MMDHSDKSELALPVALPGVYSSNSIKTGNIYLCLASEVKLYVDMLM